MTTSSSEKPGENVIIKSKQRGRLCNEVFCFSGSGRNDMLLPDSRVGGAHRRRGEPSPEVLPPCVMWLYRQLQRGVDPRQPEDHRQRAAAAQVNTASLPWFLQALLVWQQQDPEQLQVEACSGIENVNPALFQVYSQREPHDSFTSEVFIAQSHSSHSHDLLTLTVLLMQFRQTQILIKKFIII